MLVCGCGRWMHTQGVDESPDDGEPAAWLVRFECCGCQWTVGCTTDIPTGKKLVDRLLWTDDANYELERLPPYVVPLVRDEAESFARQRGERVVTLQLIAQARQGGEVLWEPDAEQRLDRVPGAVRAMAKVELERTAADRGMPRVTVALMEELKAKYFGMAATRG